LRRASALSGTGAWSDTAPMRRLTISTNDLPDHLDDRTRFELWRETYCEWVVATDLQRLDDSPFTGQWDFAGMRNLLLARFQGSRHSITRTTQQVSAFPQERYFLCFNLAPTAFSFSKSGRKETVDMDRALLFSGTEAFSCHGVRSWISVGIPKPVLQKLVPDVENLATSALDGTSPALDHLKRYIGLLMEPGALTDDPVLAEHVETTVCDLIALALGAAENNAAFARLRGLRAARCADILREITSCFADPAFSIKIVAANIGVSPSYVQQLLRETGVSLSDRVLELRMQKARRMLADRCNDHLKVSEIAFACGFNETSYFNRCFRRRFGDTPLNYRSEQG
jgi:AraC-like DNA-binding protein